MADAHRGQNIQSEQSHKSFRPLAVLAFRLIRQAWQALPDAWRAPVRGEGTENKFDQHKGNFWPASTVQIVRAHNWPLNVSNGKATRLAAVHAVYKDSQSDASKVFLLCPQLDLCRMAYVTSDS